MSLVIGRDLAPEAGARCPAVTVPSSKRVSVPATQSQGALSESHGWAKTVIVGACAVQGRRAAPARSGGCRPGPLGVRRAKGGTHCPSGERVGRSVARGPCGGGAPRGRPEGGGVAHISPWPRTPGGEGRPRGVWSALPVYGGPYMRRGTRRKGARRGGRILPAGPPPTPPQSPSPRPCGYSCFLRGSGVVFSTLPLRRTP